MPIRIHNTSYSPSQTYTLLDNLANTKDKSSTWICKDLTTSKSSLISRLFWRLIAKYFVFFRNYYQVDPKETRNNLISVGKQIKTDDLQDIHQKAVRCFNTHFPKHQISLVPKVADLFEEYNNKWNDTTSDFEGISTNLERFKDVLAQSTTDFKTTIQQLGLHPDYEKEHGFILKKDLPPKTRLFVRADLHGDLLSLIGNIEALRHLGLLDKNLKCMGNVQLIFLGDYMDRGKYDIQVLELLACLRLENPGQVHLLHGNHEDLEINERYVGSDGMNRILDSTSNRQLLKSFYETLPLTLYVSQSVKQGKRQYVHFTHALFDIDIDPSPLLESENDWAGMVIPKEQKLSERVKKILTEPPDFNNEIPLHKNKKKRRALKLREAASLIKQLSTLNQKGPHTAYTWGDIHRTYSQMGKLDERKWRLSPERIKAYMLLSEGATTKVKMIIRGHQHRHQHHRHHIHKHKVIATTLTVGMDCIEGYAIRYGNQCDRAYLLRTAHKVKHWKKRAIFRKPKLFKLNILPRPVSLLSNKV